MTIQLGVVLLATPLAVAALFGEPMVGKWLDLLQRTSNGSRPSSSTELDRRLVDGVSFPGVGLLFSGLALSVDLVADAQHKLHVDAIARVEGRELLAVCVLFAVVVCTLVAVLALFPMSLAVERNFRIEILERWSAIRPKTNVPAGEHAANEGAALALRDEWNDSAPAKLRILQALSRLAGLMALGAPILLLSLRNG